MSQGKAVTLSARDIEIMAAAMQCLKTPAEIDYSKLAEAAGFKNAASANAVWLTVKKKIAAMAAASGGIASDASLGKRKAGKGAATTKTKKVKTEVKESEDEDGAEGDEIAQPTAKACGRGRADAKAADAGPGADNGGEQRASKEKQGGYIKVESDGEAVVDGDEV